MRLRRERLRQAAGSRWRVLAPLPLMAAEIKIEPATVLRRLAALRRHLDANAALYGGAAALQIAHGKRAEGGDLLVPMAVSLQVRLAR